MVKHTQTIGRRIADELFECVWRFCGIGAYRIKFQIHKYQKLIRLTIIG